MDNQGIYRGVWAALEDGRERTLSDMAAFNMPPAAVAKWLQTLVINGYVRMGMRIVNGSPETTFRLTRYTGPLAPGLDESGLFIDYNLLKQGKWKVRPQKGIALAAKVHSISRRLGEDRFTRAWMLEQIGQKHARRLTETCRTLIQRGYLARGSERDTFVVLDGDPVIDAAHAAVMSKADKGPFTFGEIAEQLGAQIAPRTIGFIMDWVRADGYMITRTWNHRMCNTVYRVWSNNGGEPE